MDIAFAGSRCRSDSTCDYGLTSVSFLDSSLGAARVPYGLHAYADTGLLYEAFGACALRGPYGGAGGGMCEGYGRSERRKAGATLSSPSTSCTSPPGSEGARGLWGNC